MSAATTATPDNTLPVPPTAKTRGLPSDPTDQAIGTPADKALVKPADKALVSPADKAADTPESDPDVALMLEAARGSESAFADLARRHQNSMVNFFVRMGASHDSEDLVQETFVRLFRYRRQYRPSARFATFLYHLARHVWADRGRKILRIERLTSEYEQEVRSMDQHASPTMGESGDIQAALERLSPKLREVIVLNIYQGLRYQEVADVLEIPLGTVKSRINLALAALKEILDEN